MPQTTADRTRMDFVEILNDGDQPLAYIVRANWMPQATQFLTPTDFGQQMGMIVYQKDKYITPHLHLPVVREVQGTSECVIVRKGRCSVDIYSHFKTLLYTRELCVGDIILLLGGGHGFRMHDDTVLFEVKQGPFVDGKDKERFEASPTPPPGSSP